MTILVLLLAVTRVHSNRNHWETNLGKGWDWRELRNLTLFFGKGFGIKENVDPLCIECTLTQRMSPQNLPHHCTIPTCSFDPNRGFVHPLLALNTLWRIFKLDYNIHHWRLVPLHPQVTCTLSPPNGSYIFLGYAFLVWISTCSLSFKIHCLLPPNISQWQWWSHDAHYKK